VDEFLYAPFSLSERGTTSITATTPNNYSLQDLRLPLPPTAGQSVTAFQTIGASLSIIQGRLESSPSSPYVPPLAARVGDAVARCIEVTRALGFDITAVDAGFNVFGPFTSLVMVLPVPYYIACIQAGAAVRPIDREGHNLCHVLACSKLQVQTLTLEFDALVALTRERGIGFLTPNKTGETPIAAYKRFRRDDVDEQQEDNSDVDDDDDWNESTRQRYALEYLAAKGSLTEDEYVAFNKKAYV
jgi:hypothetical protein